jgi:hypothetical protein
MMTVHEIVIVKYHEIETKTADVIANGPTSRSADGVTDPRRHRRRHADLAKGWWSPRICPMRLRFRLSQRPR